MTITNATNTTIQTPTEEDARQVQVACLFDTDVQLLSYDVGQWAELAKAMKAFLDRPENLAAYKAGRLNPPSKGGLTQKQASCFSQAVRANDMLPRQRKDGKSGLFRIFAIPASAPTAATTND